MTSSPDILDSNVALSPSSKLTPVGCSIKSGLGDDDFICGGVEDFTGLFSTK